VVVTPRKIETGFGDLLRHIETQHVSFEGAFGLCTGYDDLIQRYRGRGGLRRLSQSYAG
jgi:hypothetical protein